MPRGSMALAVLLGGCLTMAWAQAPELKARVTAQYDEGAKLTGNYVLTLTAQNVPAARLVSFRVNFPSGYGLQTDAEDIRIQAVEPGADVLILDEGGGVTTPVAFAEGIAAQGTNGVWVVALLTEEAKSPKEVCKIVFTSRGRATTVPLAFEAGSVSAKDGEAAELPITGSFTGTSAAIFGDLNWDGLITVADLSLWLAARSVSRTTGIPRAFADLAPLAPGSNAADPANALTDATAAAGITVQDLSAFLTARKNKP